MWSEKVVPVLWLFTAAMIVGICIGVWMHK